MLPEGASAVGFAKPPLPVSIHSLSHAPARFGEAEADPTSHNVQVCLVSNNIVTTSYAGLQHRHSRTEKKANGQGNWMDMKIRTSNMLSIQHYPDGFLSLSVLRSASPATTWSSSCVPTTTAMTSSASSLDANLANALNKTIPHHLHSPTEPPPCGTPRNQLPVFTYDGAASARTRRSFPISCQHSSHPPQPPSAALLPQDYFTAPHSSIRFASMPPTLIISAEQRACRTLACSFSAGSCTFGIPKPKAHLITKSHLF